ncbi:MAG: C1 family peptidase [Candidatus Omnitrophica bacterium]|nr:C1 family peptidase [Candidatus Omnitrophota bacterium]
MAKAIKKYALGCLPDAPDDRDLLVAPGMFTVPEQVDWTSQMSVVRDQGNEGSCVGHAVVAVKEFQERRQYGRAFDFSERFAYEYAKRYDEWEGEGYEGTSIRGAMKALTKHGVCEESYWPYKPQKKGKPDPQALNNAYLYRISVYRSLTYYDKIEGTQRVNLDALKRALAEVGPVAVGFAIYGDDWFNVGPDGVIKDSKSKVFNGGHAVCLVAYDEKEKIFSLKNSWSAHWGKAGYGFLSYDFMLKYCQNAWSAWDA